jgi:hypothetical protein
LIGPSPKNKKKKKKKTLKAPKNLSFDMEVPPFWPMYIGEKMENFIWDKMDDCQHVVKVHMQGVVVGLW